jgi:tetraacyldisaccharide 4'-kinase
VISVGNLAVGGSGKTPCAAWLARRLLGRGHAVAVIARPVGGRVPDGEGDEIVLLRTLVPGARVIATRDKARAAEVAGRELAAGGKRGVIVVDDAFSHLALERDLDLVLLDAARPLGNGHLLPYGPLREPPTSLRRAGAIVLTRADRLDGGELARTREALATIAPGVPVASARLRPRGLVRAADGVAVECAPGTPVVCVSGLARPGDLAISARALGAVVVAEHAFADHHRFRAGEWAKARADATARRALLVVSAKDDARLGPEQRRDAHVLAVEWDWLDGGEAIERAVDAVVERGGERP